jgi:O-antigen ligase
MSGIATRSADPAKWIAAATIGIVCLGLFVALFPLVAGVAVIAVLVVLAVAPRSMSKDVEYFAAMILLMSVLSVLPAQVQFGPVTLGGVLTVLEVVVAILLLVHDSRHLGAAWRSMWPLIGFMLWSWVSLLQGGISVDGLQNAVVFTGFIAVATVAYVRTVEDPSFATHLETLFERSFWLLAVLGVVSFVRLGLGRGFLVPQHGTSRSFALLLLPMIASGLSRWRYGDRKHGAAMAAIGLTLVALSLSRAAFVTACALFALARIRPRSIVGVARVAMGLVVAAALLWAGVRFIPPLHDRFFPSHGDLVQFGGYTFSATGRTELWSLTWHQFEQSPWVGHGAGESEEFLTALGGASHPHNDYLRLLNDYGIVGTALWTLGIVLIVKGLYRDWLRCDAKGDPRAGTELWALLSVGAFLASMITANPLVYMHVQGPLGLIVGVALATSARQRPSAVTEANHVDRSWHPSGAVHA